MEHWSHFIMSLCKLSLTELPLLFQNRQLDKSDSCWGGRCQCQTGDKNTDFSLQKKKPFQIVWWKRYNKPA